MRVLWAPWRLSYVSAADHVDACIFCDQPALVNADERRERLVLYSDELASVMLNRFPYSSAHLMVAPRAHTADFRSLPAELVTRLHELISRAMGAIEQEYRPRGFNIGMNLGRCAGAGFVDHLHWHVVPRWEGDTNFMPVLADTKVMPEHLDEAYRRLVGYFEPWE